MPPNSNRFGSGFQALISIDVEHQVIVIRQDSESCDIDKKHGCQSQYIAFYLVSSMFIGASGEFIVAAQKSASNTPGDTVIKGSGV